MQINEVCFLGIGAYGHCSESLLMKLERLAYQHRLYMVILTSLFLLLTLNLHVSCVQFRKIILLTILKALRSNGITSQDRFSK